MIATAFTFYLQLGEDPKTKSFIVSSCKKTCPEDCTSQFSSEFHKEHDPNEKLTVVMGCSAFPNTSSSVHACMRSFNYTQHPYAYLLPKQCGKQKSGWKNSVSHFVEVSIKIII